MPKKEIEEQEKKEEEQETKEESGLEEEIEEEEETIDNQRFVEFLQPSTKTTAPVLKRVETPQEEVPDLEQGVSAVVEPRAKKEDERKYETISPNEDYQSVGEELKRVADEGLLIRPITRTSLETAGRDLRPPVEQHFVINPELQELRREIGASEKDYVVKAGKLDKSENKLPFQETERKYKGKAIS